MASIRPLTKQLPLHVRRAAARGALDVCLYDGGVDNSKARPRGSLESVNLDLASGASRFMARAPLVVSGGVCRLVFHHHLHGLNGRSNADRRPLIVRGAVGSRLLDDAERSTRRFPETAKAAAARAVLDNDVSADAADMAMDGWRDATAFAPVAASPPFAVTTQMRVEYIVLPASQRVGPLAQSNHESIFIAAAPTRVEFAASLLPAAAFGDAGAVPSARAADGAEAVSVFQLQPGDAFYVPRLQPVWVTPVSTGAAVRFSVQRRRDIQPLDLIPNEQPPQGRRDAEAESLLWRWSYAPWPEVAGRRPVYVAADHLMSYKDFYGGDAAAS